MPSASLIPPRFFRGNNGTPTRHDGGEVVLMASVVAEAYCAELPTSKGCVLTARRELDMVSSGILAMLEAAAAIILTTNSTELHTQNLCRIVDVVGEAVASHGSDLVLPLLEF